jgi:hypothetical protein
VNREESVQEMMPSKQALWRKLSKQALLSKPLMLSACNSACNKLLLQRSHSSMYCHNPRALAMVAATSWEGLWHPLQ